MTILVIIATVAILIFFNALYVATEFATVSARRTRINQMAGENNRMARLLLPIMADSHALDNYVAACQVGITISSLVVGAYGERVIAVGLVEPIHVLLQQLSPVLSPLGVSVSETAVAASFSRILVLVFITTLQVIMGELFPKSVAIQYPERVALWLVIPMQVSLFVLRPFIVLFNGSGNLILRLIGRKPEGHGQAHSPEEIELLVTESHESGFLDTAERQMLRNAFRLRDLTARQVMLHRTKIIAAAETNSVLEVINISLAAGFSRIPVYRTSIDDIIGFVHIKDLFRFHVRGETSLTPALRAAAYVPETMPIADLWEKLNDRRQYLTIVFDEYGGTAGLITFEDLIEEIFGELQD